MKTTFDSEKQENRFAFIGNCSVVEGSSLWIVLTVNQRGFFLLRRRGPACFVPSRDILSATVGSSRCHSRRFSTTPFIPWSFPVRGLTTFSRRNCTFHKCYRPLYIDRYHLVFSFPTILPIQFACT